MPFKAHSTADVGRRKGPARCFCPRACVCVCARTFVGGIGYIDSGQFRPGTSRCQFQSQSLQIFLTLCVSFCAPTPFSFPFFLSSINVHVFFSLLSPPLLFLSFLSLGASFTLFSPSSFPSHCCLLLLFFLLQIFFSFFFSSSFSLLSSSSLLYSLPPASCFFFLFLHSLGFLFPSLFQSFPPPLSLTPARTPSFPPLFSFSVLLVSLCASLCLNLSLCLFFLLLPSPLHSPPSIPLRSSSPLSLPPPLVSVSVSLSVCDSLVSVSLILCVLFLFFPPTASSFLSSLSFLLSLPLPVSLTLSCFTLSYFDPSCLFLSPTSLLLFLLPSLPCLCLSLSVALSLSLSVSFCLSLSLYLYLSLSLYLSLPLFLSLCLSLSLLSSLSFFHKTVKFSIKQIRFS
ncbi:uncharacterized protein [Notamacropus eugenii]|uniref:uncharacterized protein n=1 Tax=Notamacropus eugenii TaxID=9315 RepID=UPI003B67BB3C